MSRLLANPKPHEHESPDHLKMFQTRSYHVLIAVIFFLGATSSSESRSAHYRCFTITLRHTVLGRTLLDDYSVLRRDLYLKTHNTPQDTDGRIRNHNPNKRAAAHPRFTSIPHGYWDQGNGNSSSNNKGNKVNTALCK
jgi:hypothetical protein